MTNRQQDLERKLTSIWAEEQIYKQRVEEQKDVVRLAQVHLYGLQGILKQFTESRKRVEKQLDNITEPKKEPFWKRWWRNSRGRKGESTGRRPPEEVKTEVVVDPILKFADQIVGSIESLQQEIQSLTKEGDLPSDRNIVCSSNTNNSRDDCCLCETTTPAEEMDRETPRTN
jgi:hypothetical protein